MDKINELVHDQLKEHAQRYFSAILECNEARGNELKPGTYTAKELANNMKAECGNYHLPESEEFDGMLDITAETFHCSFRYRDIFRILSEWEAMAKPGKAKALFEIEGAEEKTAPVLINEKTVMGAYKTKKIRLVRITGNWWRPRKVTKGMTNPAYYELNGVLFSTGKTFYAEDITERDYAKRFCERFNDEYLVSVCRGYIRNLENAEEHRQYYTEVLTRANIDLEEKEPKPMAETNCKERPTLDDHKYYTWLMMVEDYGYQTIAEQALAEALTGIILAAYKNNSGHLLVMTDNGILNEYSFTPATPSAEDVQTHETTKTEDYTTEESKREMRTFDALAILEAFTKCRRGAQPSGIRRSADGSTLRPIEPSGILHTIRPSAPPGADRPPRAGPSLYYTYHTPIHSPP